MDQVFDEKKSSKMILFFGNAIDGLLYQRNNGKIIDSSSTSLLESGYIEMQYYPEQLSSGRSADYSETELQYGVGSISSYQGTSGVSFEGIETYFTRDIHSSAGTELKTSPDYNYSVEAVIALFNLLLLPRYDKSGNMIPPPLIWIDFGFDLFGYGKKYVSRFILKEFSYDVLSIFQTEKNENKIRAISCNLSLAETVYYENKIDVDSRYIQNYRKVLKKELKGSGGRLIPKDIIHYNFKD